jgi:hypothetical protein
MTTRKPWTDAENVALACLYFIMLDAALDGQRYVKTHCIKAFRGIPQASQPSQASAPLAARSRSSIEFKLRNAAAAHAALVPGAETMHDHGFLELPNMQKSLKDAMRSHMMLEGREFEAIAATQYD